MIARINLFKEGSSVDKIAVQLKYANYLKLLSENELVLRIITELKEKMSGDEPFEIGYLRLNTETILATIKNIIALLNRLSDDKYRGLNDTYGRLKANIEQALSKKKDIPVDKLILDFAEVTGDMIDSVGGKNAQIGEIRNKLNVPVPKGFVITAYAYRRFLEYNQLEKKIHVMLAGLDINNFDSTSFVSRQIQSMIGNAAVQPELLEAIEERSAEFSGTDAGSALFSVRSSAVGESTEFSFAGQYATFLGVAPKDIPGCYKKILASKFAPRALFYLTNRGFREDDIAMSAGCMEMVDAKSSGVMHTINPFHPDGDSMVINSIFGLGRYIVEGDVPPDLFEVSKSGGNVIQSKTVHKLRMLALSDSPPGVEEKEVPDEAKDAQSITGEQIKELVSCAVMLETYYKQPQIIEWAYDYSGRLFILQTSPLIMLKHDVRNIDVDPSRNRLLVGHAETASPGVGYGPVFVVNTDDDIPHFPNGAIMVTRYSSPTYVGVMNRAKGIVAEIGSPTGHMATLAREFQIPTIVNAYNAGTVLKQGMMVSIDADRGCVYDGYAEVLFREPYKRKGIFKDTPVFVTMEKVLEHITPLNLIDPYSPDFTMASVHTLHDIVRFAHQAAMDEMFLVAQNVTDDTIPAVELQTESQFKVYIIDLGDGVKREKDISESSIISVPFLSFWKGVKTGGAAPRAVSGGGFMSVVMNTMANPGIQKGLYEKNLALISREYMNFNIRMGYHLSIIEGLCTKEPHDNYVRFIFQGGGADIGRRIKRAQLISAILQRYQFRVKQAEDMIRALYTKCERDKFEELMGMLGRLTVFTKQLDMSMEGDSAEIGLYTDIFFGP
ncbi:MAG: PEP-utilizing enzyme [Deltaproteobacteria bacterium]|nr:PEP-utilizing enzyme [Deltaproteobacteria bacterium]MCL5277961.1 PEP-utilizing enzyme [Deltaproteobacteria bacterium]